jgi:hypothetical protein
MLWLAQVTMALADARGVLAQLHEIDPGRSSLTCERNALLAASRTAAVLLGRRLRHFERLRELNWSHFGGCPSDPG